MHHAFVTNDPLYMVLLSWIDSVSDYSEVPEPQCVMVSVRCPQGLTVAICTKTGPLHSLEIIHLCTRFCRTSGVMLVVVV